MSRSGLSFPDVLLVVIQTENLMLCLDIVSLWLIFPSV